MAPEPNRGAIGTVAVAPSLPEALPVWLKIGMLSFGGPAGQIAMMHRILVDEKKWIDEQRYLSALNFCMLLPGPEATQLATYVGWRLHGLKGGLAAGLLFVLPGACIILALAAAYAAFGKLPLAEALFVGVKAAVLAIVFEALLRVARRALKGAIDWGIATAAFVLIAALQVPFPALVLAAGLFGYWRGRGEPLGNPSNQADAVPIMATLRTIALWLLVWFVPLMALGHWFGADHVVSKLALFFSKLAVVTFGGAYAVLAYMAQDVAQTYRWLTAGEMLDALGLAETTPGPLILVTEFVGYLAAHRFGGGNPVAMGVLGAAVVLWATFVPCYLWIFAGAPYIERINAAPRLRSALAAITAAVVGVILNLSLWFAINTLFRRVSTVDAFPFRLQVPVPDSIDGRALALSGLAFALLFAARRGIVSTLAACGGAAIVWHLLV